MKTTPLAAFRPILALLLAVALVPAAFAQAPLEGTSLEPLPQNTAIHNARAAADAAADLILGKYNGSKVTEDGLWTAAIEGMLAHLDQAQESATTSNNLLTPEEVNRIAELRNGLNTMQTVSASMMADGVGYLRISLLTGNTALQLDGALAELQQQGASSLILDLRDSPGGALAAAGAVADRFLPAGTNLFTLATKGGNQPCDSVLGNPNRMPLSVMVNRNTASASELLAAALADNDRATVVGTPTQGKNTAEEIFPLADGWGIKMTIGTVTTGTGSRFEEGIQPQVLVPMEDDTGDWQLEAAIQLALQHTR